MTKKTILFLSDHPLVPSGVGNQAKLLIEGLLATGKYRFVCLGGALQHPSMQPQMVSPDKYGDDWRIFPVTGHGDKQTVRQFLTMEKIDAVFIFTDPRFFMWLWEMEDEIRAVAPLVYWHVWDNDPTPMYNRVLYESTDYIVALSMKTKGMLDDMGYERCCYIPHAVPAETFKPLPDADITKFRQEVLGGLSERKFVVFWNNRNARRKRTGDVIASFAKFAEKVGRHNVALLMHTQVKDQEGQDIAALADRFKVGDLMVVNEERRSPEWLNSCYNAADVTINLSDNEGFGLGTLESLSSGTPIVVNFTGGLQYQVGDWWKGLTSFVDQEQLTAYAKKLWRSGKGNWWGAPVFPAGRSCTGSQPIPYIYSDIVSHDDVVASLKHVYDMGRKRRKELGIRARQWVRENFDLARMVSEWDGVLETQISLHQLGKPSPFRVTRI